MILDCFLELEKIILSFYLNDNKTGVGNNDDGKDVGDIFSANVLISHETPKNQRVSSSTSSGFQSSISYTVLM